MLVGLFGLVDAAHERDRVERSLKKLEKNIAAVFTVSSKIAAWVVGAGRIDAFALDGTATYLSKIAAWVVGAGRIDAFALDGTATYLGAWTASGTGLAGNSNCKQGTDLAPTTKAVIECLANSCKTTCLTP